MTDSTMDKLLRKFKTYVVTIAQELEDSGFFKNTQELGANSQTFLRRLLKKRLDNSEWPIVLFNLTRLFHTLFKRQVILLVDEYDMPTSYAVQHRYFPKVCYDPRFEYNVAFNPASQANEFFREVFSPLLKVGTFLPYRVDLLLI